MTGLKAQPLMTFRYLEVACRIPASAKCTVNGYKTITDQAFMNPAMLFSQGACHYITLNTGGKRHKILCARQLCCRVAESVIPALRFLAIRVNGAA